MSRLIGSSRALSLFVLTVACLVGAVSLAQADSVLVTNYGLGDRVERFTTGGAYTVPPFVTGLSSAPISVVQGGDSNIYVGTTSGVTLCSPEGEVITQDYIWTGDLVTDLAWHDGKLWLATWGGTVAAYDVTTGQQSGPSISWTGIGNNPYGIGFGPDGRCYVCFYELDTAEGTVWAWNTTTNATELIVSPGGNLTSLDWNGSDMYICRNDAGQIYKWSQAAGLQPWATGPGGCIGIAIDNGKLYCGVYGTLNTYSLADASLIYFAYLPEGTIQQICVIRNAETPTFDLAGGHYSSARNVTITSATPGATIYYTTDGSEPTETSLLYAVPIVVDHNMRLKAKAYKAGSAPSDTASADYVIGTQPTVVLAAGYNGAVGDTIEKFTLEGLYIGSFITGLASPPVAVLQGEDSNIYVGTTTGVAKYGPDASLINASLITTTAMVTDLAWHDGKLWLTTWDQFTSAYDPATGGQTGPAITWPTDETNSFSTNPYGLAFGPDGRCYVAFWTSGDVLAWDTTTGETQTIMFPALENAGGLEWVGQYLYISTSQGNIYQWDENMGLLSTWIAQPAGAVGITIGNGTLYSAIGASLYTYGVDEGNLIGFDTCPSNNLQQICIANVADAGVADAPTFSPDGAMFDSAQLVTIDCATPGATIYYTTNGSDPTDTSTVYTGPVNVDHDLTLKARAYAPGMMPSSIKGANYRIGPRSEYVLVTAYDKGEVWKFTLDGEYAGTFVTRSGPVAVIQGGDGNVYVGGLNGVSKYKADGTPINLNFITSGSTTFVSDLAWHEGKLWLCDYYGYAAAFDPETGAQSGPSTTIGGNPYGIKFGPDGLAYVVTFGSSELLAWDTAAGTAAIVAAPVGGLTSLCWVGSDLYIAANHNVVYKMAPDYTITPWAYGNNSAIGITAFNGKLYRVAGNTSEFKIFSLADASTIFSGPCYTSSQAQQICILSMPVTPILISEIKNTADGTTVGTGQVSVTAVFADAFYVEDAGRTNGIQVRTSAGMPAVDTLLTVKGIIKTDAATGERYIDASLLQTSGTYTVDPLGMTNKALGGGPAGLQAGIDGAAGVNNIGMLVRTTGIVVSPDAAEFYLNDGSAVTVKVTGGTIYAAGAYVDVTGISSCELVDGKLSRVIRALAVNKLKD